MPLRSPAGALVPAVFVSDCGDAEEGVLWGRGSVSLPETSGPAPTTETASDSFLQVPLPHASGWPGLRQLPLFSKSECLPKACTLHAIPATAPRQDEHTGEWVLPGHPLGLALAAECLPLDCGISTNREGTVTWLRVVVSLTMAYTVTVKWFSFSKAFVTYLS